MRVLIIEDDKILGSGIKRALSQAGHTAYLCLNGDDGLEAIRGQDFDALILDLKLPTISDFDVLRTLRKTMRHSLPVLILTALDSVDKAVTGLNSGADDYMTKPFDIGVLLARLNAIHRRTRIAIESKVIIGDVEFDPEARTARKGGIPQTLNATELKVLTILVENRGRVIERARLEDALYGWDEHPDSNVIEVSIYGLRKKLGRKIISTLRGVGYVIEL